MCTNKINKNQQDLPDGLRVFCWLLGSIVQSTSFTCQVFRKFSWNWRRLLWSLSASAPIKITQFHNKAILANLGERIQVTVLAPLGVICYITHSKKNLLESEDLLMSWPLVRPPQVPEDCMIKSAARNERPTRNTNPQTRSKDDEIVNTRWIYIQMAHLARGI